MVPNEAYRLKLPRAMFAVSAASAAFASFGVFSSAPSPAVAPRESHPVVLISIDGRRPDYVTEADRHGLAVPNLRRLLRDGSYASGVVGVVPTVTYPSHATLVTGVSPARHGIHSNTTFDPLAKNQGGWYWYAKDVRVPALWDAVAERGLTSANVHWPVTVGARITYNLPQYWRTGTPSCPITGSCERARR